MSSYDSLTPAGGHALISGVSSSLLLAVRAALLKVSDVPVSPGAPPQNVTGHNDRRDI